MITFLVFILIFGLLVFVHELGHFLAARSFGVQVKTFAFGFPPRIWSKKVKDTTYAINALPLGGYVSLRGEDEYDLANQIAKELGENISEEEYLTALEAARSKESNNPASLHSKNPWQLIIIFISGVAMNILLAIILLWTCFLIGFQPIYGEMWNHPGINNDLKVVVSEVEKNTPAETVGILPGDIVRKVDGVDYYTSADVTNSIRTKHTDNSATVVLNLDRDGQNIEKTLSTYRDTISLAGGKETEVSRTGVVLETKGKIGGGIIASFGAALSEVINATKLTFVGVFDLFGNLITKFKLSDNVTGPVGIVMATDYFTKLGPVYLIQFAFILSVSLAVFNVLPIPGLDGGHIAIVIVESISRKKLSTKTKNIIQLVGFGSLILLMIAVSVKDFINFDIISLIKGVF